MPLHFEDMGFGGNGGGGSAKFPTMVTDSGSSLPVDLTGYNEGDTFLNTTDKKVYKITPIYSLSSNYTKSDGLDVSTGEITGFSSSKYIYRGVGSSIPIEDIDIHFKTGSDITTEQCILCHYSIYQGSLSARFSVIIKNGSLFVDNNASDTEKTISQIKVNTDYHITGRISSYGSSFSFSLVLTENGTQIYSGSASVNIATTPSATKEICFGIFRGNAAVLSNPFLGTLYGDTKWRDVMCVANLSWDSGTSLTDKTEYADKTNGILYLYEDDELVNIPQKNTILFTNVSASSWVADSTYTDYGYKCELSCSGVTSSMYAMVNFAPTEADSGNYATVCLTGTNTVTIYSKVNDTITIPSIVVMGV